MLEIYNENLRDLLADGRSHANARLDILATQASGCNVPGATQVSATAQLCRFLSVRLLPGIALTNKVAASC
jgi:hypothetical protein